MIVSDRCPLDCAPPSFEPLGRASDPSTRMLLALVSVQPDPLSVPSAADPMPSCTN